jgi:nitric oxide reductase NorE protein
MTATLEAEPTTEETGHIPGQPGIWFFVLFESLIFTSYFCVYLYSRTHHERSYLHSQADLSLWLGILDTIVLLTSSWAVARCVQLSRAGRHHDALRAAWITAGFGVAFAVVKVTEWVRLIRLGDTFTSSGFFQSYFFLTGIHFVHLLIGFVALGILIHQLSGPQRRSQETVETCATYWHTVDFIWVLIFALLYVVR